MPHSQNSTTVRRVWLDILIGSTVVAWGGTVIVIYATRGHSNSIPALIVLTVSSVLTVTIIMVGVATFLQRTNRVRYESLLDVIAAADSRSRARHAELLTAVGQTFAQLEQMSALIGHLRQELPDAIEKAGWQGYATALRDTGEAGRVTPLAARPTNRHPVH